MINVEHNRQYSAGLLLLNCFWTLVFGYFALQLDNDPIDCEASDENDYRFGIANFKREERFIDVGFRFRLTFKIAFASYLAMTIIGTVVNFVSSDIARKLMFLILALMNYAVVFAWVFAFYVRMQHSGKVCSGDFLEDTDPRDGYLIEQGRFIKFAMIAIFTLFIVAVTLVLCKIVRTPEHKPEETELERL